MGKILDIISKVLDLISGFFAGRERKKQVKVRTEQIKEVKKDEVESKDVVDSGDVDRINDEFGWK